MSYLSQSKAGMSNSRSMTKATNVQTAVMIGTVFLLQMWGPILRIVDTAHNGVTYNAGFCIVQYSPDGAITVSGFFRPYCSYRNINQRQAVLRETTRTTHLNDYRADDDQDYIRRQEDLGRTEED